MTTRAIELKHAKAIDERKAELKTFEGFEIKDEAKGEIEAIVATLDVIDRDGDIIRTGAIKDGSKVVMSASGHGAVFGDVPVGKGVLVTRGAKVVFEGKVFMSTNAGRESLAQLKEMGADQQWSFGYFATAWEVPTEAEKKGGAYRALTKVDSIEVSPVLRGAGIGTRTLSVKEEKKDDPPIEPKPEPKTDEPKPEPTAEEVEAQRVAAETAAAAETKAANDARIVAEAAAARQKRAAEDAVADFHRIHRTHQRLGYTP